MEVMESARLSDFARAASGALAACAAMACLAFVPLEAHAASKSDLDHHHKKWWAWAEVGGFYDSEYDSELEVEVFLPIAQSAYSLFFLDIEGELFANDMQDGAVALGYRQMFSNGWNLGVWAGPEVRRTREGNRFWRFDAGLELLHPDYDFRLNAYTPFTGAQAASPAIFQGARHRPGEVVLKGNEIFMWNDFIGNGDGAEVPLWGFDGEVGVRVPLEMAGLDPHNAELRLYGGGFYFDADEAMKEIAGPKARVELRFYDVIPNLVGSRLTAEYEYSYDDVRGDRHQAGARLRIPFGSPRQSWAAASQGSKAFAMVPVQPLTRQERRMLDALEREDVFTTRGKLEKEPVGDYLTGVIFDRVAYAGPGDDLSDVSDVSGDYTLIIVNGVITTTETEDIQGFQTVQGGQSTIPVFGVRSGRVVDFTAPGDPAFIDSTVDGDVLNLLGDHTHIAGLDINGNGTNGHGINVGSDKNADPIPPGTWNIVVDQTVMRNATGNGDDGVHIGDNNAHVLIFNETAISSLGSDGIEIGNNNQNVLISGVDISNMGSDGIEIRDNNQQITIEGVRIDTTNDDGIEMGDGNSQITISGVSIGNRDVDANGAPVTNIGGHGILVEQNNTDVVINDATIFNTGLAGIRIGPANNAIGNNQNIQIMNVDLRNIGLSGDASGGTWSPLSFGVLNTATVTNVTIDNAAFADGIYIDAFNQIDIANVQITNSGGSGISVLIRNTVTISDVVIETTGLLSPSRTISGDGIRSGSTGNNVTITNARITGTRDNGIELMGILGTATITNTTITGSGENGIFIGTAADVLLSGVTIDGAGEDGLQIVNSNTITMTNTTFTGAFGDDVIHLSRFGGNTLSGDGNVFDGTFGDQFCEVNGAQTGSFGFDVGPQPTCP